jgi:hypothetical protein
VVLGVAATWKYFHGGGHGDARAALDHGAPGAAGSGSGDAGVFLLVVFGTTTGHRVEQFVPVAASRAG